MRNALDSDSHHLDNGNDGQASPENKSNESTPPHHLANGNNDTHLGGKSNVKIDLKAERDDIDGLGISRSTEDESKMEE